MCPVRAAGDHERDLFGRTSPTLLAALPLSCLRSPACGGNASHALPTTSDGRAATVGVTSTGLGDVLVDRQGHTLYLFARDAGTRSSCRALARSTGRRCMSVALHWSAAAPSRRTSERRARPDGINQLTYNGHPVYTFVNDKKPGETNGEGVNAFGGSWFAVSPEGAKVAPRSQPQSGGGYGGGY